MLKNLKNRKPLLSVVAVLLLISIATGFWYVENQSSKTTFSGFDTANFTLPGNGEGLGMSFNKPNSINKDVAGIENSPRAAIFVQLKGDGDSIENSTAEAFIAAQTRQYPQKILGTNEYKDQISERIADVSSPDYERRVVNVHQFVTQIGRFGNKVTMSTAKPFASGNIQAYAWSFDLSVADINSKNPPQEGKAIYALGNNGWYYFFVSAEKSLWQENLAFFDEILNSVKVDQ